MVWVWVATVLAGPMRCEAVYSGAGGACELSGTWSASGVGKSEARARKAAQTRLGALVQAAALHRGTRGAGAGAQALAEQHAARCLEGLEAAAQVHCFEEPGLGQRALCLTRLPESSCWRGLPIEVEAPAWRATETGQALLCREVAVQQASAPLLAQHACQMACNQQVRTTCLYDE